MVKWIVIGILVLAGFGAVFGHDDAAAPPTKDPANKSRHVTQDKAAVIGDDLGAQTICRQFAEARLKAPSTADFSGEAVRHVRGPNWTVVGDVDAENSFGAPIRNKYVCKVRFAGNDRYRLVDFTFL